jgi:hypothetical protein
VGLAAAFSLLVTALLSDSRTLQGIPPIGPTPAALEPESPIVSATIESELQLADPGESEPLVRDTSPKAAPSRARIKRPWHGPVPSEGIPRALWFYRESPTPVSGSILADMCAEVIRAENKRVTGIEGLSSEPEVSALVKHLTEQCSRPSRRYATQPAEEAPAGAQDPIPVEDSLALEALLKRATDILRKSGGAK